MQVPGKYLKREYRACTLQCFKTRHFQVSREYLAKAAETLPGSTPCGVNGIPVGKHVRWISIEMTLWWNTQSWTHKHNTTPCWIHETKCNAMLTTSNKTQRNFENTTPWGINGIPVGKHVRWISFKWSIWSMVFRWIRYKWHWLWWNTQRMIAFEIILCFVAQGWWTSIAPSPAVRLQCRGSSQEETDECRWNSNLFNWDQKSLLEFDFSSSPNLSLLLLNCTDETGLILSASRWHDVPLVGGGVQGLWDGAESLRQRLPQHPEPESGNQVMTETFQKPSAILCELF